MELNILNTEKAFFNGAIKKMWKFNRKMRYSKVGNRDMFCYKGNVMQRRVLLMFVLFVVVAGFYTSVTHNSVPTIQLEQKAQTEMFNQLDERALSQVKNMSASSGN